MTVAESRDAASRGDGVGVWVRGCGCVDELLMINKDTKVPDDAYRDFVLSPHRNC